MTANTIQCLKNISSFFQSPLNKLNMNTEKMPTCNFNNKSVTGFTNIILTLLKENKSILLGSNLLEEAEIRQWLEYSVIYASQSTNTQVLQELNDFLTTRTYFVGNKLTIADVALFYILEGLMTKISYLDKEKYLNFSRWFDNIQQNDSVRKDRPLIDFSTIFLSCVTLR